ncbi:MarC family protein [Crocosphaera sp. Alani8]|uniref:MarC family protein n=1 Tax=Crocosphaera sp. Alani8 TaxID=3038952 RepID=UPI00313D3C2D
MKLIQNRIDSILTQFKNKRWTNCNTKLIFSWSTLLIYGFIFFCNLTILSVNSFAQPLDIYQNPSLTIVQNACGNVDECMIISSTEQNNDSDQLETDLRTLIEHQIRFIQDLRKIYGKDSWSRLTIILFMTIGPLKIIPVFTRLTQNASKKIRIQLAVRSFALSTLSIFTVALTSESILNKYKISLSALIVAAGIVLFLISLKMLLAQYLPQENNPLPIPEDPLTALISPLTFPTILTPQGIALVMISMTVAQRLDNNANKILGLIMIVMILNLLCMLYARQILILLKPTLLQVLNLMLSIVQLALAISFIFSGVTLQILTINYILKQ